MGFTVTAYDNDPKMLNLTEERMAMTLPELTSEFEALEAAEKGVNKKRAPSVRGYALFAPIAQRN
eukprot:2469377-Pyramimonas_sp.AAC.1